MKFTKIDWMVIAILIFLLTTHFATAFAVEYYRDITQTKEIVKAIEGDPVAEVLLSIGKIGAILKILMVASLFGLYFGILRKYQFSEEHKLSVQYLVCTIFFASLYMVVNDLAHLLGLLL